MVLDFWSSKKSSYIIKKYESQKKSQREKTPRSDLTSKNSKDSRNIPQTSLFVPQVIYSGNSIETIQLKEIN